MLSGLPKGSAALFVFNFSLKPSQLPRHHQATYSEGAVSGGYLVNGTVTDNSAANSGGGTFGGCFLNSLHGRCVLRPVTHLAGCWTRYALATGIEDDEIVFPAGGYQKTSENPRRGPRIELLFAAGDVARAKGQGQGCTVLGTGELQTAGPKANKGESAVPLGVRRARCQRPVRPGGRNRHPFGLLDHFTVNAFDLAHGVFPMFGCV